MKDQKETVCEELNEECSRRKGNRCKGPVVSELLVHSKQGNSGIRCGLNGQQRLDYVESLAMTWSWGMILDSMRDLEGPL